MRPVDRSAPAPWRILALPALLLAACSGDNSASLLTTTVPAAAQPQPLVVEMPLTQTLRVSPQGDSAPTALGRIAYAAAGLGNNNRLGFGLIGGEAARFSISATGEVTANGSIPTGDFPVTLIVSGSVNDEILASSQLTIELISEPSTTTPPTSSSPVTSVVIAAGQAFRISDTAPGALVGQIDITTTPAALLPALELSGEGAEYFAIDSAGRIIVARPPEAEQFSYHLLVSAAVPFLANPAQASLAVMSAASAPAPPPALPPAQNGAQRPPLPASARVFAANASQTVPLADSGYSEASPPGSCVARFANQSPVNDSCWAMIPVNTAYGGVDYPAVYQLDASETGFVIADNLLLIKNHLRIATPGQGAPATERTVLVSASFGGEQASAIELTLPYRLPMVRFQPQRYETIDTGRSPVVVGPYGFSIENGGPHRRLSYQFDDQDSGLSASIDAAGRLLIDTSKTPLTANRRYFLTATAEIRDFPAAGKPRHTIAFTTSPPRLSFPQSQYDLLVRPADNRAHALVAILPATSAPAQALYDYEIADDAGDSFYTADGGQIYLTGPLSAPASATLRVVAGDNAAMTSFTVSVGDIDFTATPVDAAVNRRNIQFTALLPNSLSASSYAWDFGDGSAPATTAAPVYAYSRTGVFEVVLEVTDSTGQSHFASHNVYAHEAEDPYKQMQWHLRQQTLSPFLGIFATGQLFVGGVLQDLEFSTTLYHPTGGGGDPTGSYTTGVAGEDIRAIDHISACGVLDTCRGEGIVVLVADSGAQIDHPDLIDNTRLGLSRNLMPGAANLFDPFPANLISESAAPERSALKSYLRRINRNATHGTSVAGIILAKDGNDIGVTGVAPQAELASYNLIDAGVSNITQMVVFSADHDVSNHSWATSAERREFTFVAETTRHAVAAAASEGRGGRGTVFVKSAGNTGAGNVVSTSTLVYQDDFGNRHSSGLEGHNTLPEVISVAGVLGSGEENIQSEAGSNVLLSAYWGLPCRYQAQPERILPIQNPVGIVTTDLAGDLGSSWGAAPTFVSALTTTASSFVGASSEALQSRFASAGLTPVIETLDNPNDYNYCFNGTSGAAPQVSGAAALMLQARPDLGWRDVRAILVNTARQNDSGNPLWNANGSGRNVHPHYGYGVIDTSAAVAMARSWTLLADEATPFDNAESARSLSVADCSVSCGAGADANGTASTDSLSVSGQMGFVETAEVSVQISFQAAAGQHPEPLRGRIELALEHRDPQGALLSRAVLQKRHPYLETPGIGGGSIDPQTGVFEFEWTYLSVAHYGEDSAGTWSLVATDFVDDGGVVGIDWSLRLRGH